MSEQDRKKPCAGCPFSRQVAPGGSGLGRSEPTVYIGQAFGPFFLACHNSKNYEREKDTRLLNLPQCAGAAVFREHVGAAPRMPPSLLHLAADREKVFATPAEFLAHHSTMTEAEAEAYLRRHPPIELLKIEMGKREVRHFPVARPKEAK